MKRIPLLLFIISLLGAVPVHAAERLTGYPAVRSFKAARFEVAPMSTNGVAMAVGQGEMTSPQRAHLVLKTLQAAATPEQTLEIVLYDGTTYVREDTSTQWYIDKGRDTCCIPPADQSPEATIKDFGATNVAGITHIGSGLIANVPTDQYQIWIPRNATDNSAFDHLTLDFWIGQQANYVHQIQLSFYSVDPNGGRRTDAFVERFSDFDGADIRVSPPVGAVPRASQRHDRSMNGVLPMLSAALATPALLRFCGKAC